MRFYWIASDLGEVEITIKLREIYGNGDIFEKDVKESEIFEKVLIIQF